MRAPPCLSRPPSHVALALAVALASVALVISSGADAQRRRRARIRARAHPRGVLVVEARRGFTLEAGLGLGITEVFRRGGDDETRVGVAPLGFSIGGYVSPRFALLFRASGTSYWRDDGRFRDTLAGLYAFHVKWWATPRLYLGGGAGLALFGEVLGRDRSSEAFDAGVGGSFRLGLAWPVHRHHALGVGFELFTLFFGDLTVLGQAVAFEWHYFG